MSADGDDQFNDLSLFSPLHNGTETSKDAAESVQPHLSRMNREILRIIRSSQDGATCDEIEVVTGLSHQTASARVYELHHRYRAIEVRVDPQTGRPTKRKSRSERDCRVYYPAKIA